MAEALDAIAHSRAHLDPDYPRFHLAPPVGRLNDPNGLVVIDGAYHAFYQFSPFFPRRKSVFWGHARSTDLLSWQTLPPAIAPDDWYDRQGVYSGGATVANGTVWLHYTGNVKRRGTRESYQCAATTTDLAGFVKHPANPLIPAPPTGYTAHVRDPQVIPDGDGHRMLLGAQRSNKTGCILSYRSSDLIGWTFEGELTLPGSGGRFDDFGYMWECPNLLRVPDEATGEWRDVLIFCPQGIDPDGDSFRNRFACGYLVGRLDGTAFHTDADFRELDRGFEFYAPQVFRLPLGAAPEPPILLGWLGNAAEDAQPSLAERGWVHAMTIPRRLVLHDGVLHQRPALEAAAEPFWTRRPLAPLTLTDDATTIDALTDRDAFVLHLDADQHEAEEWSLTIGTTAASELRIAFRSGELTVDRSPTRYPHGGRRTVRIPDPGRLRVELIHDRSITELFVDDGQVAFSLRSYLEPGERRVRIQSRGALHLSGEALVLT